MRVPHHMLRKVWREHAPLVLPLIALLVIGALEWREPERFTSHEVTFTDTSTSGLAIMPASCASNPPQPHQSLPETSDGYGYSVQSGWSEYGLKKIYFSPFLVATLCVTNTSGGTYFIPAKTAAELKAFHDRATTIPNLTSWYDD